MWRDGSAARPGSRRSVVAASAEGLVLGGPEGDDPLGAVLERLRARTAQAPAASSTLGWWGWFGYELGAASLGVDAAVDDGPAAALLFATAAVELDHDAGTVCVVALPGHERDAEAVRDLLLAPPAPRRPSGPAGPGSWSWRHPRDRYLMMIDACRTAIAAGDAYQLCLTNRIDVRLPAPPDAVAVFDRLRATARVPAAALLQLLERASAAGE